jgi:hypothetical protein
MTSLPRTQLRSILWIIFAAAIFTGPSAFALDVAKRTFDLPADDAEKTLKLFAQQSGEQTLYPPTEVSGVQTNAVKGQMTPGEALSVMLDHTILIVVHDEKTGGYAIHRAVPAEKVEKKDDSRREERSATTDNVSLDADKTVVLSPFTVMANVGDDRYEPTEASSGGRVRVNIFESSQNVSVISLEVMRDAGADRVLDAMKFVPGVSESSIPNGLDRMNIRGFLTTSRTLDGITTQYSDSQGNIDPFIVERLEIVKGPNSILAPAANPGGTINNVSKKPGFTDFGSVAIAFGGFDAGRVEVDLNHVDPAKKLAVRVLSAMEDEKDYFGSVTKEHLLAPMFTYKFSPTTEITWQIHYIDHRIQNYYDGRHHQPGAALPRRPAQSDDLRSRQLPQ